MVMLCSNNLHHAHLFDPFVCSLEIANLYCFRIIFKTESSNLYTFHFHIHSDNIRGRLGRDRMVATTTYAISAYHHWSCELQSRLWRGVLDTTLYDKVCHWLATGRWFSPGTPVTSTNRTDGHDISEILLKVALSTIKPNQLNTNILRN